MTVSKTGDVFYCFNPACNETGTVLDLVMKVKECNFFVAMRFISQFKESDAKKFTDTLKKKLTPQPMPTFDQAILDRMHETLLDNDRAVLYLKNRGFTEETVKYFRFGYSSKNDMIATPMHDLKGNPVGVIGRTIEGKRFKNSVGLPVRQTMFNIHRAKRAGDEVVIVESNFDAARVHQAGFPCVVANLGGSLSDLKIDQLNKTFNKIVIFTDDDKPAFYERCARCTRESHFTCVGHYPGLELGKKLARELSHKQVSWAYSGEGKKRLPAKDAGDMTDEDIKKCIENRISNYKATKMW